MSFYTDVIQKSPKFQTKLAVRDMGLLEPRFRAVVTQIMADAAALGKTLTILETYRSVERQEQLYEAGATQLRTVGVHHYGLACDLGIVIGGRVDWKGDYGILGTLAQKHGVIWGGDWGTPNQPHSFRDYDHIQAIRVADQPRLFAGTWYPDDNYHALA